MVGVLGCTVKNFVDRCTTKTPSDINTGFDELLLIVWKGILNIEDESSIVPRQRDFDLLIIKCDASITFDTFVTLRNKIVFVGQIEELHAVDIEQEHIILITERRV